MPNFRFNLPTLNQLTPEQQIALMSNESILVSGGPGSGKTVVSVRRLLRLKRAGGNVKLFTFNRTLMAAIKGLAVSEGFDANIIDSLYDWYWNNCNGIFDNDGATDISRRFLQYASANGGKFSEVIIDEAQDFEHRIIQSFGALAHKVSCGADRDQGIRGIYGENAEEQILAILHGFEAVNDQLLQQNFRNTREVFAFARKFVPRNPRPFGINIETMESGDKPELFDNLNVEDQLQKLREVVELNQNDSNIGILVHFKSHVKTIRDYFRTSNIVHSYYYQGMPSTDRNETENNLQSPLVTTFASCKGLEFDVVILPFFESADWALENGQTIDKHYYVASTRARRQLIVFYNETPYILSNFERELYKLNGEDDLFNF